MLHKGAPWCYIKVPPEFFVGRRSDPVVIMSMLATMRFVLLAPRTVFHPPNLSRQSFYCLALCERKEGNRH